MKIWVLFCAAIGILAQQPAKPPPNNRILGEVTAKDAAKLTVKADGSGDSYTVTLTDATAYLKIAPGEKDLTKATKATVADVNVGDRVIAQGQISEEQKVVPARRVIVMTKSDLEQKAQKDRAEWTRRGASGKVAAVTSDGITITTTTREGPKPLTVVAGSKVNVRRYAPDSVRFNDAKPSALSEIKAGDQVRVLGDKTEDGTKLTAEEIVFGTFRTIPATFISYDSATGELKVTDLDTKKPLVVKTSADSSIKKLNDMMARMIAMQVNPDAARAAGGAGMRGAGAAQGEGQPGGGAAPAAAQPGPAGVRPGGSAAAMPGHGGPGGGPGGPGGRGPGGGMRGGDLSQMLERLPAFSLAELKPGDALIISSTVGAHAGQVSAITILAGVEPILQSAPRSAGNINLGSWSLDMGAPQ